MLKPKALIFDYGNVLCQPQRPSDIEAMAAACGLTLDNFQRYYWQLREEFDRADFDVTTYWQEIGHRSGSSLTGQQVQEAILLDCQSWSRPCARTMQWVQQLSQAGIKTAVLSNMPLALREYIDANCAWLNGFDHKVFSCDVLSIKPDEKIYRHCLELLQLDPDETLFLDDRSANVEAAQKIGMKSVIFTTLDETIEELRSIFDLPLPQRADRASSASNCAI
jgi:putative hydrolase of the HAD superfamily